MKYKINRYWHKCKQCGNKNGEYYIKENGPHYGLYCDKCDKWIKWIKQNELFNLLGYKNINKVYDCNNKEISIYSVLDIPEMKSLDEYIDVKTLSNDELEKLDLPF